MSAVEESASSCQRPWRSPAAVDWTGASWKATDMAIPSTSVRASQTARAWLGELEAEPRRLRRARLTGCGAGLRRGLLMLGAGSGLDRRAGHKDATPAAGQLQQVAVLDRRRD